MTVTNMINNFLVEYDRVSSLSAPSYENAEILQFLNRAQYDIVDLLFSNKRLDLLDGLTDTIIDATPDTYTNFSGAKSTDTSDATIFTRYLYYIASYSEVTRTAVPVISSAIIVKNVEINKSDAVSFASSNFNSSIFRFPKCYVDGILVIVIPDAYTTVSKIYVDYLKSPKELVTTVVDANNETIICELRESLHEEVVTKAVQLAQIATNPQLADANIKLTNKQ